MEKVIFLEEIFFEKMWGSTNLANFYKDKYTQKAMPLGEVWGFSGHRNGVNKIRSGIYNGKNLNWLWKNHPEIFGEHATSQTDYFPIQIRLVDALKKLSIQVHPNDEYARKYANDNGKNECWYVLSAAENAKIIYGHNAMSEGELRENLQQNKIEESLNYLPVKTGDFIFVPTGTMHAIGDDIFLIEVAECSDTTYRFYDYNRIDQEGNKRELHLQESLEVLQIPQTYPKLEEKIVFIKNGYQQQYLDDEAFTVEYIHVQGESEVQKNFAYYACYLISGGGEVAGEKVKQGDFFLITNAVKTFAIKGTMELFVTYKK